MLFTWLGSRFTPLNSHWGILTGNPQASSCLPVDLQSEDISEFFFIAKTPQSFVYNKVLNSYGLVFWLSAFTGKIGQKLMVIAVVSEGDPQNVYILFIFSFFIYLFLQASPKIVLVL